MNGSCSWIVVHDPLGVGAFEKDSKFSEEDVVHGLRFRTFTLGTVLCHRKYGEFKVMLGNRRGQSYKLSNAECVAFPSSGQKLIVKEKFV
jgi:hypothetical protein